MNNSHPFPQEQCTQQALFLSGMNNSDTFNFWIVLIIFLQSFLLLLTWAFATATVQTRKEPSDVTLWGKAIIRQQDAVSFFFSATTVLFGVNVFVSLLQCLAVQSMRYCRAQSLDSAPLVVVWVVTGVLGGAGIGSAALFWVNALACVVGCKDKVLPWYGFVLVEAGIVLSPLLAVILVLMGLVKVGKACADGNVLGGFGKSWETRPRGGRTLSGESEENLGDLESGGLSRASTAVPLETFC